MGRLTSLAVLLAWTSVTAAAEQKGPTPVQQDLLRYLDSLRPELVAVSQDIWAYAELGLEEHRSAARLVGVLKKAGFKVREGVSNMPTAFVAEYGSGKPVIGILAEYDALPELSQKAGLGRREPAALGRTSGHGCGHCALGTAAVGAAMAVKEAMAKHKLPGTIRLYGTPAEETVIGKVYMTLDGQFSDLDACLLHRPRDNLPFDRLQELVENDLLWLASGQGGGFRGVVNYLGQIGWHDLMRARRFVSRG